MPVTTLDLLKAVAEGKDDGQYVVVAKKSGEKNWMVEDLNPAPGQGDDVILSKLRKVVGALEPPAQPTNLIDFEDVFDDDVDDAAEVEELDDKEFERLDTEGKAQAENEAEQEIENLLSIKPSLKNVPLVDLSEPEILPVISESEEYFHALAGIVFGKWHTFTDNSQDSQTRDLDLADEYLWRDKPDDFSDNEDNVGEVIEKSKYYTPARKNPKLVMSTKKFVAFAIDEVIYSPSTPARKGGDSLFTPAEESPLFTPRDMQGVFDSSDEGTDNEASTSLGGVVKKLQFSLSTAAPKLDGNDSAREGLEKDDSDSGNMEEGGDIGPSTVEDPQIGNKHGLQAQVAPKMTGGDHVPPAELRRSTRGKSVPGKEAAELGDESEDEYLGHEQIVLERSPSNSQNQVFRDAPTSCPTTLLETRVLSLYGLKWNTALDFIVCMECEIGLGMDQVWYHLRTAHNHHVSSPAHLHSRIMEDLTKVLGDIPYPIYSIGRFKKENSDLDGPQAIENWRATVRPSGGSREPIEGLKICRPAYCCNVPPCSTSVFPYVASSLHTMDAHWRRDEKYHKKNFRDIKVKKRTTVIPAAQTILQNPPACKLYFPVNISGSGSAADPSPVQKMTSSKPEGLLDIFRLEAQTLLGDVGPLAGHSVLVNPAFKEMQMTELWDALSMADVRDLLAIKPVTRRKSSQATLTLINATVASFMASAESAKEAHGAILGLIMSGGRVESSNRLFYIPQRPQTLSTYVLFEIQFLRHMLHMLKNPIKKVSGHEKGLPVFQFDALQSQYLQQLDDELRAGLMPLSAIAKTIVTVLHSLYFPPFPENAAFNKFSQPLVAYIAVMSLTPEGSPIPLSQLPVFLAKVQFSMRLRAYQHIYISYSRRKSQISPSILPKPGRTAVVKQRDEKVSALVPKQAEKTKSSPSSIQQSRRSDRLARKPAAVNSSSDVAQLRTSGSALRFHTTNQKSPVEDKDPEYAGGSDDVCESSEDEGELQQQDHNKVYDIHAIARSTEQVSMVKTLQHSQWYQDILAWLNIHLTETNVSSYSSVRMFMHLSSSAQRNAKKIPFIQWKDDNTMLFHDNVFDVSKFIDFVEYQLGELEELVRDALLFGSSLDEMGIKFDLKGMEDSGDVTTIGYSALFSDGGPLNPDAEKFLVYLAGKQELLTVSGGQIHWKTLRVEIWAAKIAVAVERLAMVCHILQGAPGRGSEEVVMQTSNTTSGRRHLFILPDQGLMLFFSNYWKGAHQAGRFNEVVRVLPYRASRLLFALIRVVRPVELLYLAKAGFVKEKETATEAYLSSVWASRGNHPANGFMLKAAQKFFHQPAEDGTTPFAWVDGVRTWRHLVVALQRRHFPNSRYTKEVAQAGTQIADSQAGRATITSTQNYAVLKSSVPADSGLLSHYIIFSRAWHTFFGQSTEFDASHSYIV